MLNLTTYFVSVFCFQNKKKHCFSKNMTKNALFALKNR
jgi:hypothetical protein